MMTNEVESHILEKYEIKKRLGKGAYGIVWKVVDKKSQEVMALKKIFDAFRNKTDAQRTFREIAFLKQFHGHPNIIKLYNVLKAENDKDIYLTFEFMETDLHNVIKRGNILKDVHKQYIMYQLLKATKYLHSANVIHRDQKPSNVLLDSDCFVKLCDFGLARSLSERDTQNPNPNLPPLTEYVATRWYRAPEILMASHRYTKGVDMWSLGCILGEMILGKALFPGKSTMNQIDLIMTYIPKPDKEDIETMSKVYGATMVSKVNTRPRRSLNELIPNADETAMNLIIKLLQFNPDKRCTIEEALSHSYVKRFHNAAEEISMGHDIIPPVDDDIQLSVDEYRTKLYKFIQQNKAQKKARKRASAKLKSLEADAASGVDSISSSIIQSRPASNSMTSSSSDSKKVSHSQSTHDLVNNDDLKKIAKDYLQENGVSNQYTPSPNETKSPYKEDVYNGYSKTPSYMSKENRNVNTRNNSGTAKLDRKETDYNSYMKHDQKIQETSHKYNSSLELSSMQNKVYPSSVYSSTKNSIGDNNYDKVLDYPIGKSSPGFNNSFYRESRHLSGNELRKSQSVKRTEYDLYRKSMFSPGMNDMVSLNATYSHYPSYEERGGLKTREPSEILNDQFNSRPRSRSLRASYSNFNTSLNDSGTYGNKKESYNGYVVNNKNSSKIKSRGSYENLTKTDPYSDSSFYKHVSHNHSKERSSNNNNSSGYIGSYGMESRPASRGLNSTWFGTEKSNIDSSFIQNDAKRQQSAPIGYSSTINLASRPPTSGVGIKNSSKYRNQIYSDYNNRMMSRAKTPSTKIERNKTPGSYFRSNSPGTKYLSSDYNQRPVSRNSANYESNSRYSQKYGSVSNNQLAHYYSRQWIS